MLVGRQLEPTQDLNVRSTVPLIAPRALRAEAEVSLAANRTVVESREAIKRILTGDDPRMFAVVGPCSIHDPSTALEYARRLKRLADQIEDRMFLVMRVYFEKPRTTLGWKGLINDPHLNDTFDIATGLRLARKILLEVAELGVPAATEML
jgi:3-deoxy-7-phosphoheptulonate synthase